MASLRKRPADIATVDAAPPVEAAIDTPAPAPQSASPPNDATSALQRQIEALRQSETLQQQAQAMAAAQQRRQAWVQSNELAQSNYAILNDLHGEALRAGFADTSPEYFDFLNGRLAALHAQQPATAATHLAEEMQARAAQDHTPEPPQRKPVSNSAIVSAPVSREVPSSNGQRQSGRITLTREQLDAAKIAGVTPAEYARQLLRLNELKASGEYSERR